MPLGAKGPVPGNTLESEIRPSRAMPCMVKVRPVPRQVLEGERNTVQGNDLEGERKGLYKAKPLEAERKNVHGIDFEGERKGTSRPMPRRSKDRARPGQALEGE